MLNVFNNISHCLYYLSLFLIFIKTKGKGGDILLSFRWNPRDEIFYLTVKECSNLAAVDSKGQASKLN